MSNETTVNESNITKMLIKNFRSFDKYVDNFEDEMGKIAKECIRLAQPENRKELDDYLENNSYWISNDIGLNTFCYEQIRVDQTKPVREKVHSVLERCRENDFNINDKKGVEEFAQIIAFSTIEKEINQYIGKNFDDFFDPKNKAAKDELSRACQKVLKELEIVTMEKEPEKSVDSMIKLMQARKERNRQNMPQQSRQKLQQVELHQERDNEAPIRTRFE